MARLIHSARVTLHALSDISQEPAGESALCDCPEGLPTLYDNSGHFVEVVNQWLLDLKTVKRLVDITPAAKALLRYWKFLERENLEWNCFPPVNRLKPTYRFRSYDLLASAREGKIAFSTANNCMGQVVRFYTWAMENRHLIIEDAKQAPFKIEFVVRQNNDLLAHLRPRILVQTQDLRIRVPGIPHHPVL